MKTVDETTYQYDGITDVLYEATSEGSPVTVYVDGMRMGMACGQKLKGYFPELMLPEASPLTVALHKAGEPVLHIRLSAIVAAHHGEDNQ